MKDDAFFKYTPRKKLTAQGLAIEFPILYYDLRQITAIFSAKTSALKKILPHPNYKPIELFPGTSMLGITCFEYQDTSIGPYNEIAITVPVKFPPGFTLPGLSALSMMMKNDFTVYIHHLPVTTEIAYQGGVYFWNYPKFISEIIFKDQGENLEVTLKENGEMILVLRAKKIPLNTSAKQNFHTYSIKDKVVMHGLVEGWAPKMGKITMGKVATLELGKHRISQELAELNLSQYARTGIYAEGMMTKLYAPDKKWNVDTMELLPG